MAIQPLDRLGAVSLSNRLDGLLRRAFDKLSAPSLSRGCAPANEHVFVITRLASPGVVIQPFDGLTAPSGAEGLDGHGAERLAMTFSAFIAAITQAPRLLPALAMTRQQWTYTACRAFTSE